MNKCDVQGGKVVSAMGLVVAVRILLTVYVANVVVRQENIVYLHHEEFKINQSKHTDIL